MTSVTCESLTLNAALPGLENPFPRFRDPDRDRPVRLVEPVSPRYREGLGAGAGARVLPYLLQDTYSRTRTSHTFRSVVVENSRLRAVFLPELGARLVSLTDKATGRELLYRNPCIQPANLAIRNAWFSGGIEWNIGQLGHTCTTFSPVFSGKIPYPDGTEGLRVGEFDRMNGLFWQIDFRLSETEPVLWAHTRVTNPLDRPLPMYWWTNIAVPETPGVRVLAPADRALALVPQEDRVHAFAEAELPGLPSLGGADGTYPGNSPFSNEFFFLCENRDTPWEAVVGADGQGFFETSTERLPYRKVFVWGTHAGGRRWQDFLAPEGGGPYLEIQAGLGPTQLHGRKIPGETTWSWTEGFGPLVADPAAVRNSRWAQAVEAAAEAVNRVVPRSRVRDVHREGTLWADCRPVETFTPGAPWGRLEGLRLHSLGRKSPGESLVFGRVEPETLEADWLTLLEMGFLPERNPDRFSGGWMVQPEWRENLTGSLKSPAGCHWYSWVHQGVLLMESGDEAGATRAWEESYRLRPSVWAARNLGFQAARDGRTSDALVWYSRALEFPAPVDLAREYFDFLVRTGTPETLGLGETWVHRWPEPILNDDRIRLLRARWHLARREWNEVLGLLDREYACIREGELTLDSLWAEAQAGLLADRLGVQVDEAIRTKAAAEFPPPRFLDFRIKA